MHDWDKALGLETWKIRTGNCMNLMASMELESIDLAFADPPYNIGIAYKGYSDSLETDKYLEWCETWIERVSLLLKPTGSFFILNSWEWAPYMAISAEEHGLHVKQWIVWYETFGTNCTGKYNRTSRPLLWCVRNKKHFTFNAAAVTKPSARLAKYHDKRAKPTGKIWDDVWNIPRLCGTFKERQAGFPTQLPLALLRPIVGAHSNPGDIVLDPFSGSATTGMACLELGRRYHGLELSDHYAEASRERMREYERIIGTLDTNPASTEVSAGTTNGQREDRQDRAVDGEADGGVARHANSTA
jgi:DNA modification methylase